MIELDEDTRCALAQALSIALGEASAQFAGLVDEAIELSVTQVDLLPRTQLVARIEADSGAWGTAGPGAGVAQGGLCRVGQGFHSGCLGLQTEAMLLLPERGSLEIVRRLLGDEVSDEPLNEIEQDALGEIGNTIINSCMNSLAHIVNREMNGSLPVVCTGSAQELFQSCPADRVLVVLARIGMRMATRRISGHVIFLMNRALLQALIEQMRQFFGLATHPA